MLPRFTLLFALVLLPGFAGAAGAPPSPIELEAFFRRFDYDQLSLSPDGSKIAAIARQGERLNLFVIDRQTKQPRRITNLPDKDIAWMRWISNERLVFTVTEDSYAIGGLFAVNADGSRFKVLAASVAQQGARGSLVYRHTGYMAAISDTEILVRNNDRQEFEDDVYELNTLTGRRRLVARNPGGVQNWLADHTGAVRAAFGEQGLERFVLYRDKGDGEWREVRRSDSSQGDLIPLDFTADNQQLYVASSLGRDTLAVHRFDPATGALGEELFAHPVYDAEDVRLDRRTQQLLGVSYDADRPAVTWLDPRMSDLQQLIDEALPDGLNRIVSRSDDGRWVILLSSSDRDPGTYFLLETQELAMEKLVSRAPWIDPKRMAAMQPIEYTARDGLPIHGYLTLPLGADGQRPPLIVHPHGGPWVRDSWGFNRDVQFLASRGYAVLQINFRGSTGYGRRHLEAGYNQWGLAMQDDITDGVRWAIDQGHVDPQRVGIYGASYGGYATMAGLTFTPELYRCGINYVGVTDLSLLLRTIPKAWEAGRARLESMTGNRRQDRERLEATSPLRHVARIQAPLLLAYGELDPRVVLRHAHELIGELKRHNKPHQVIIKRDEAHGFYRLSNQLDFYTQVERFLDQHLRAPERRAEVEVRPVQVIEQPASRP